MWIALALLISQPEEMGPHAIEEIDAGNVVADGVEIPVRLFAPMSTERFPVVGVVHGFLRDGSYQRVMAETFASHGFVAVVPDMPCGLSGCDHDANARQLRDLIEWAATQSAAADRVDGERRALVGHSWGGLGVHLATSIDPTVDAVVCLDPNDDRGAAFDAAPNVSVPSATVIAENIGACNNTNWGGEVYPRTAAPHLRIRVVGSGHCDVEDPSDNVCEFGCGAGDPNTSYLFRRYAIAFVSCVVAERYGEWIGGASMSADENAGAIDMIDHASLETLPCRAMSPPIDGGVPGVDAAQPAMDAAQPGIDAAIAKDAGADAGTTMPSAKEGGCTAISGSASIWLMALLIFRLRRRTIA